MPSLPCPVTRVKKKEKKEEREKKKLAQFKFQLHPRGEVVRRGVEGGALGVAINL